MDQMIYGLDLPDEIVEQNEKILMKKFNITEKDIEESEEDDDR